MRLLLLLLMASSMMMCKTNKAIIPSDVLSYVVSLSDNTSIKTLEEQMGKKLVNSQKISKLQNIWKVDFATNGNKSLRLKRDLLNLDYVISVLTVEEYEKQAKPKKTEIQASKKILKQ